MLLVVSISSWISYSPKKKVFSKISCFWKIHFVKFQFFFSLNYFLIKIFLFISYLFLYFKNNYWCHVYKLTLLIKPYYITYYILTNVIFFWTCIYFIWCLYLKILFYYLLDIYYNELKFIYSNGLIFKWLNSNKR